jgi:hypothetical protein
MRSLKMFKEMGMSEAMLGINVEAEWRKNIFRIGSWPRQLCNTNWVRCAISLFIFLKQK